MEISSNNTFLTNFFLENIVISLNDFIKVYLKYNKTPMFKFYDLINLTYEYICETITLNQGNEYNHIPKSVSF